MRTKKYRYEVSIDGAKLHATDKKDLDQLIKAAVDNSLEVGTPLDISITDTFTPLEYCDLCNAVAVVHISGFIRLVKMKHLWREHDDLLRGMGIGQDGFIDFAFCTNCGTIQGAFPKRIHGRIITTETEGYHDKDYGVY